MDLNMISGQEFLLYSINLSDNFIRSKDIYLIEFMVLYKHIFLINYMYNLTTLN